VKGTMQTKQKKNKKTEKESKLKVRDLKPTKDVKGAFKDPQVRWKYPI
jgi:hypothetical protein